MKANEFSLNRFSDQKHRSLLAGDRPDGLFDNPHLNPLPENGRGNDCEIRKPILIESLNSRTIFRWFAVVSVILGVGLVTAKTRQPARAGQFYPGTKTELSGMIGGFMADAERTSISGKVIGLWAPHAGYVFSGQIAANAFKPLKGQKVETAVILGPAHTMYFTGAALGDWDAFATPLGSVQVDTAFASRLLKFTKIATVKPEAHVREHSIEVQIPFLQTVLPGAAIVPIVLGEMSYEDCQSLARAIASASKGHEVLIVASSDMSHYPSYDDATRHDKRILDAVAKKDAKLVWKLSRSIPGEGIPNLECVLCGAPALVTAMLASAALNADAVLLLPYANSGDASGERDRVVGYGAALFYQKTDLTQSQGGNALDEIPFTEEETAKLFKIARESIAAALAGKSKPSIPVTEPNLLVKRGVFVTLTNKGRLRGCIGHFGQDTPLHEIVSEMASAAATQDYRFMYDPVTPKEMESMDVKISVLSGLRKIRSIEEIEIGKHGIWIRQGSRSGTYLPEVATEMGWDREEFVTHCSVEKAGLSADAYKKGAEILVYTSQILEESGR